MVIIVYIVMLLCLLTVLLRLSLLQHWAQLLYSILFLAFSLFSIQYAIHSSRNEVEAYLSDTSMRQNVAILVTLECMLFLMYIFRQSSIYKPTTLENNRRNSLSIKTKLYRIMLSLQKYYISLLCFPTLFFIQTQLVYKYPGKSFHSIAWQMGLACFLGFPLGAYLFKLLLPEKEMREELHLLLTALVCITALLSTSTEQLIFSPQETRTVSWDFTLGLISFLCIAFATGYLWRRLKPYKLSRQRPNGMDL